MESRETVRAAKVLLVAGGLLLIGIVVGFILAGGTNSSPVLQAKESVAAAAATGLESPFTTIADRTLPGVVSIETKRTVSGRTATSSAGCFPRTPHRNSSNLSPSARTSGSRAAARASSSIARGTS
jgi:uncharacterized protein (UPF0333 family)